jgi:phosphopantetheinyl transferase
MQMRMANAMNARLWRTPQAEDAAAHLRQGGIAILLAHRGDTAFAFGGAAASGIFSSKERERALRFHRDENRDEFLLGRFAVRTVLAAILGCTPGTVPFGAPRNRKPALETGAPPAVDVSISHSRGWVACAFAAEGTVGVDIELEDRERQLDALSTHIMSASELEIFGALGTSDRSDFFYDVWRHKEAVLKAAGLGLAGDMRRLTLFGTNDGRMEMLEEVICDGRAFRLGKILTAGAPAVALAFAPWKPEW